MQLEKQLARDPVEIMLVSRDNFFLFTPMLHEIAASDLDLTTIVNPVRKMLRRVHFFVGEIDHVDLGKKKVFVSHGFERHQHAFEYDLLVIGLGSVTNFYGIPGVQERALTMRSLSDAMRLRNHLIAHLEEADSECCTEKEPLLTFVVAGGGFAGVETVAGINDFVRGALRSYPHLKEDMVRVVLIHSGRVLLPELGEKLGAYAQRKLEGRKVEICLNTRVESYSGSIVRLTDGTTWRHPSIRASSNRRCRAATGHSDHPCRPMDGANGSQWRSPSGCMRRRHPRTGPLGQSRKSATRQRMR